MVTEHMVTEHSIKERLMLQCETVSKCKKGTLSNRKVQFLQVHFLSVEKFLYISSGTRYRTFGANIILFVTTRA